MQTENAVLNIELDYELEPSFAREMEGRDLTVATSTDLEFRLFCSDLFFRVDGESLDARWGWIPIVGFADQLFDSAAAAARGAAPPDVEFTESQDRIRFRLIGDRVQIAPSYSDARPTAPASELLAAADAFLRRVLTEVATHSPAILKSEAFEMIRRKVTNNPIE